MPDTNNFNACCRSSSVYAFFIGAGVYRLPHTPHRHLFVPDLFCPFLYCFSVAPHLGHSLLFSSIPFIISYCFQFVHSQNVVPLDKVSRRIYAAKIKEEPNLNNTTSAKPLSSDFLSVPFPMSGSLFFRGLRPLLFARHREPLPSNRQRLLRRPFRHFSCKVSMRAVFVFMRARRTVIPNISVRVQVTVYASTGRTKPTREAEEPPKPPQTCRNRTAPDRDRDRAPFRP